MEPQTGEIKACRWYQLQIFSIRSRRSRCKTSRIYLKPFVYATIEQLNMSPCDSIVDGPFMIRKGHNVTEDWEPKIPIINTEAWLL
jgi:penicillin-binding protein 1A